MRLIPLLLLSAVIYAQPSIAGRNITFNDLYSYPMVGDVQLSPDGKTIAFVLTKYDTDDGTSSSDIYLINSKGGEPRRLTNNPAGASHPRWSPDGRRIAFISKRDKNPQIWMINIHGGEAYQITSLPTGAYGVEWSPDGEKLIFTSRIYPNCETDSSDDATEIKRSNGKTTAMLFKKIPVRHYSSWSDGEVNHLFIHNLKEGRTLDLTPWSYNVPPFALGGSSPYTISPDGDEVCFVMNTDSSLALSTNNDIFTIDIKGGTPKRITLDKANDTGPTYSPNGKYIAYRAMSRSGYESDKNNLMLYDRRDHKLRNLTPSFPLSVGGIIWSRDSKYIYFSTLNRSWNTLFKVSLKKGKIKKIWDGAVRWDYNLFPDGRRLCYLEVAPDRSGEIFACDIKSGQEARLTYYTEALFEHIKLGVTDHFWFIGADGDSIHGILTKPPDFDVKDKYPLVLLIHGGPQWSWLDEFNYYGWNKYLVAAQGYVVAQIDPHGSRGYGQKFTDAVNRDWGGKDYNDLMLGIDFLLNEYDFIDSTKLAAMGRSYGGFMTNWIEGHTNRFKCLVSVDGLFDQPMAYYSTDELWFPEWEFGGTPWENPKLYAERSPSHYVMNFKTPMLIIHGGKDYRVDLSQALGMFTALQRLGVESEFLYFPDEGHSVHRLRNLRYFYDVQFSWLKQHLR